MSKEHAVIFVPGLDDAHEKIKSQTRHLERYGFRPTVFSLGWRDGEGFKPKLTRLVTYIDSVKKDSDTVSLVGASAGGSAALNAYYERAEIINAVVCVSSRLREGLGLLGHGWFGLISARSTAFNEAVKLFQEREKHLLDEDLAKIMTIQGRFDQLVPHNVSHLEGSRNLKLDTLGHERTIRKALTSYEPLVPFLNHWSL